MMEDLLVKHDELLASKPSDVEHDVSSCPICQQREGGDNMQTYTEEEVAAAIAEAVAPIQAKLDGLMQSRQEEAIQARVEEAVSEVEVKIADVQRDLDSATLRAETAEAEKAEILAWLESEAAAEEQRKELEARREARLEVIKEVASFSEEYVEQNITRWVALSEEDFASLVEDWKAIKPVNAKKEKVSDELPSETALKASRESSEPSVVSVRREVARLNLVGIDPRTI